METLIKNVNILNPNEEIQTSCNVLIEDKHIKQISRKKVSTKNNVKIIDGQDISNAWVYRLSCTYYG